MVGSAPQKQALVLTGQDIAVSVLPLCPWRYVLIAHSRVREFLLDKSTYHYSTSCDRPTECSCLP